MEEPIPTLDNIWGPDIPISNQMKYVLEFGHCKPLQ